MLEESQELERTELRIIIAGGRDFNDYGLLSSQVSNIINHLETMIHFDFITIISGNARGADRLGERYAKEHDINLAKFPAQWDRYGKRAGYLRNEEMAKYAVADGHIGVLIVFWDGESVGTKQMIRMAEKYGLESRIIKY